MGFNSAFKGLINS